MKPPRRSLVSSLIALQLMASAPAAFAQGAPPPRPTPPSTAPHAAPITPQAKAEAEQHFKRGLELFDEDDFQGARIEFGRAYQIAPNYRVLYNLGQVSFQLQDYVNALHAFEKFLAEGGSGVPADRREEVERDIAKLRIRVATVEVTAAPGAVVSVDGVAVGNAPLTGPIQVSAGRRVVRAALQGREPVERSLELAGGDSVRLDLIGQPLPEANASPSPVEPEPSKSPPWALWGLTGALVVGTAVTGILAMSASSSANGMRTGGGSFSDYESAEQRMRTFSLTADIIGAATIVVGAIAIYFTVASTSHNKKTGFATPAPRAQLGPRAGVLSLSF